tara:strand:+ start:5754 stop:5894 length:141 start_codon:yes stop_codon:yes gene_type:complete
MMGFQVGNVAKFKFYEAKSIVRNSGYYSEKTVEKAKITISQYELKK